MENKKKDNAKKIAKSVAKSEATVKPLNPMERMEKELMALSFKELAEKCKAIGVSGDIITDAFLASEDKNPLVAAIMLEKIAIAEEMISLEEQAWAEKNILDKFVELNRAAGGTGWPEKIAQSVVLHFVSRYNGLPETGAKTKNCERLEPVVRELFGRDIKISWPGNSNLLLAGALAGVRLVAELIRDDKTSEGIIAALKENRIHHVVKKHG